MKFGTTLAKLVSPTIMAPKDLNITDDCRCFTVELGE